MRDRLLTRSIHELSAAANDASAPAVFSNLGVLKLPASNPPRPQVRKHGWHRRLAALATKPHEYFGLTGSRPETAHRCGLGVIR